MRNVAYKVCHRVPASQPVRVDCLTVAVTETDSIMLTGQPLRRAMSWPMAEQPDYFSRTQLRSHDDLVNVAAERS